MDPIGILRKAHYLPLLLLGLYITLIGLLTIPAIQREFVYLHHIPLPIHPDFANPQASGLAPFKTRNLELTTSDGETLGAWHVLPSSYYRRLDPFPPRSPLSDELFERAFADRPTVIYFHGNAGSRASRSRVRSYSSLSSYPDCNVLAIDYRGFGDSTGTPSEAGLLLDARAAWNYVTSHLGTGSAEDKILLIGQSLGTGVVAGLAGQLALDHKKPRALVLIAPFTSVSELITTHRLLNIIPLLSPLKYFPRAQDYLRSFLIHPFDSTTALAKTATPILILHAENDRTIPETHASALFSSIHHAHQGTNGSEILYPGWGVVRSFERAGKGGKVVWWEGLAGGHNGLGYTEGTLDLIAEIARL